MTPKLEIMICNSGASNTSTLTGLAAYELLKKIKDIGILSLPALANKTPRQLALVKKVKQLIVIDGCKNECAKKIADSLRIKYDTYINLEYDLGIKKIGPFTTLEYKKDDVEKIKEFIKDEIINLISRSNNNSIEKD